MTPETDESAKRVARAEKEIDDPMDLWDVIEAAVWELEDEQPAGKEWLPADVEVEIRVR